MDAANNQRILGYFIEEAKEHLETIEKGILELSSVVEDAERVNEMFRAAHSVKGGAAMLGYGSIQKTAHRLEDAFKILKDNDIEVNQKLESLFFKGYDVLQDLIESLQGPFGLQDDEAEGIMQKAEPTFVELQDYLNQLLSGSVELPTTGATLSQASPVLSASEVETISSLELAGQVRDMLKEMLQLFKQKATPESRQKLQRFCDSLAELAPDEKGWQTLVKTAESAIANPKYSYATLAPVVIKELKGGSDCMELGKGDQIAPSEGLHRLASAESPQILVTLEPKAAANILIKVFNKQQLSQLVQLLEVAS
ncbi:MAG: Hpt domain-containing protein [Xenococcaceae cyanobacterium]